MLDNTGFLESSRIEYKGYSGPNLNISFMNSLSIKEILWWIRTCQSEGHFGIENMVKNVNMDILGNQKSSKLYYWLEN